MITPKIRAYLQLEQLPKHAKVTRKGVTSDRKIPRFDTVKMLGFCPVLDSLKNIKGELYFNLNASDKNEQRKKGGTTPEYYLQCRPPKSKTVNFSGLRFQYMEDNQLKYASGEPSQNKTLRGGLKNPLIDIKDDGFLFLFSDNMQMLEVIIVENARHVIDSYRKQLSIGGFYDVIEQLRESAIATSPLY